MLWEGVGRHVTADQDKSTSHCYTTDIYLLTLMFMCTHKQTHILHIFSKHAHERLQLHALAFSFSCKKTCSHSIVHTHTHPHTHTSTHTHIHTHYWVQRWKHIHMHKTQMMTHRHTNTETSTLTHKHRRTYWHSSTNTYIHTQTQTHLFLQIMWIKQCIRFLSQGWMDTRELCLQTNK